MQWNKVAIKEVASVIYELRRMQKVPALNASSGGFIA